MKKEKKKEKKEKKKSIENHVSPTPLGLPKHGEPWIPELRKPP